MRTAIKSSNPSMVNAERLGTKLTGRIVDETFDRVISFSMDGASPDAGRAHQLIEGGDPETLHGMLVEARAVVTRLETLLAGSSPDAQFHPIVAWRRRRNMSQAALARAVGISGPALWHIEHSPGLVGRKETRSMIAQVLNVPEEWLVAPESFVGRSQN